MRYLFLAIYHYKQTHLPCRVTDPAIQVKLVKSLDNKEIELGEATAVSYNPKIGFILQYPNPYFEDRFECIATSPEGKKETQLMVLKYLSKFLYGERK